MPQTASKRRKRWRILLAATAALIAAVVLARRAAGQAVRFPQLRRLYLHFTEQFNLVVLWYKLPLPLALANFVGMRMLLRERPQRSEPTHPALSA